MKRLLAIALLAATMPVAAQDSGYSFKGLRLGMTRQDLTDLILTTPWDLQFREVSAKYSALLDTSDHEPTAVSCDGCEYFSAEYDYREFAPDSLSAVACGEYLGKPACAHFAEAGILFLDQRIAKINIVGHRTFNPCLFEYYVGRYLAAITAQYGAPSKAEDSFSRRTFTRMKPGSTLVLAIWHDQSGKNSIMLQVASWVAMHDGKSPQYEIRVLIQDEAALVREARRLDASKNENGFKTRPGRK